MDGYELAQRLRAGPEGARIRLIALTGYGQAGDRARSNAAGFERHFVKPVDHAQIAGRARQWSRARPQLDAFVGGAAR